MKTLLEATKEFLETADYLQGPDFTPLRVSLVMLAEDYDADRKPAQYAQYGLILRFAMSLKPEEEVQEINALEEILAGVSL